MNNIKLNLEARSLASIAVSFTIAFLVHDWICVAHAWKGRLVLTTELHTSFLLVSSISPCLLPCLGALDGICWLQFKIVRGEKDCELSSYHNKIFTLIKEA